MPTKELNNQELKRRNLVGTVFMIIGIVGMFGTYYIQRKFDWLELILFMFCTVFGGIIIIPDALGIFKDVTGVVRDTLPYGRRIGDVAHDEPIRLQPAPGQAAVVERPEAPDVVVPPSGKAVEVDPGINQLQLKLEKED